MNFEFEDYRNHKKPKLGPWPLWVVPEFYVWAYIFRIIFLVFALPYLFGFMLTPLGYLVNFLLVDYVVYVGIKKVYGLE